MYDPKTVKLTEPIKSIVEWVEELESNISLYNKRLTRFEGRMKKFEKGIEAMDEWMRRIEKYAK